MTSLERKRINEEFHRINKRLTRVEELLDELIAVYAPQPSHPIDRINESTSPRDPRRTIASAPDSEPLRP